MDDTKELIYLLRNALASGELQEAAIEAADELERLSGCREALTELVRMHELALRANKLAMRVERWPTDPSGAAQKELLTVEAELSRCDTAAAWEAARKALDAGTQKP